MNHWYKTATNMTRHHKPLMLMATLGDRAFFCLHSLLGYVTEHRPTGDLTGLPDAAIEVYAQWTGERGAFVTACVEVGIIDKTDAGMAIHDFGDFNAGAAKSLGHSEAGKRGAEARWGKLRQSGNDGQATQGHLESDGLKMARPIADKDLDLERDPPPSGRSVRADEAPPKGSKEWPFSEADMAILKGVQTGMISDRLVPTRIGQLIQALVRDEKVAPGVVQAFYEMTPETVARWVKAAMDLAREKCRVKTAHLNFAASTIAREIEAEGDLLVSLGLQEAKVVGMRSALAPRDLDPGLSSKPWAEAFAATNFPQSLGGVMSFANQLVSESAATEAARVFRSEGFEAACDWVWDRYQRKAS